MFRELLSIFSSDNPIARMGADFSEMLELAHELTALCGGFYFEKVPTADERSLVYSKDVQINKLQRRIRKQVVTHLTLDVGRKDAPYCLLLMSLVKDVERIGDYCKNLAEVYEDGGGPLPDDENTDELREIRNITEASFDAAGEVFTSSDATTALDLMTRGRAVARRCDALVARIARNTTYNAATTTTLILGTRYYKRINAHLLNVLSGIVMPLHKLDYYDERMVGGEAD